MIMKTVLAALLCCVAASAEGLYTDTYMSHSGIVHPVIDTGIPSMVKRDALMKRRIYMVSSLYFDGKRLDDTSLRALREMLTDLRDMKPDSYYISLIGHTASFTSAEDAIPLKWWSNLWQNTGYRTISRDALAASVNRRIHAVYDILRDYGIDWTRIYTENRMDRDPISTEATSYGRSLNKRVTITVYR